MTTPVNVSSLIDDRPVGRFQLAIMLLCGAVLFTEGFDAQAIAYVAPSISADWGLAKGALGPVFAAGLCGIMLGSLIIAPLADRMGRRKIIIGSVIAFGFLTLITPLAWDATSLLVIRFLTGFGLGGAMANAISLTSEYSPVKRRAFLVMVMFSGFSMGSALGGFAAAYLIPHFGWHAVFYLGGVAPLLLVPVLFFYLPESLRFLASHDGASPAARRLIALLDPQQPLNAVAMIDEEEQRQGSVRALFSDRRAPVTALLWLIFFSSLLVMYLIVNWLPTILHLGGASVGHAAIAGSVFQIGGLVGTLVIGLFSDRLGAGWTLMLGYLFAAFCIGLIAHWPGTSASTLFVVAGAGFGLVGGQIAANAMSATFYPTAIRSTGVGWSLGIGRIGSILGPLLGGMLLGLDMPVGQIFLLAIIPMIVAAIAAAVIELMRRSGSGGFPT